MRYSFQTMTTEAHLHFQAGPNPRCSPDEIAAQVEGAVAEIVALMGPNSPGGDLKRLNDSPPGHWIQVHPRTWHVLEEAALWYELSGGAFDPSAGTLKNLFNFQGYDLERWPEAAEPEAARQALGLDKIKRRPEDRSLSLTRPGQKLDFGAIAKGYAVDRAIEVLEENGLENALAEIGGEVKAIGLNPGPPPRPWRVGIEDPRAGEESGLALELSNAAVASSGHRLRYFNYGGRRYSHIIDPRTLQPITDQVAGVTVAHPSSCMTADALSTALSILGPDEGLEFLRRAHREAAAKVQGVEVIMFIRDRKQDIEVRVLAAGPEGVLMRSA